LLNSQVPATLPRAGFEVGSHICGLLVSQVSTTAVQSFSKSNPQFRSTQNQLVKGAAMAPTHGEKCENCMKHIPKNHHFDGRTCSQCLAEDVTLQRCKGCLVVRYCVRLYEGITSVANSLAPQTKECQREHWKIHKIRCQFFIHTRRIAETMGVTERHNALKKWVYKNAQNAVFAGATALGLHYDRERTGTSQSYFVLSKDAHEIDFRDTCLYRVLRCYYNPIYQCACQSEANDGLFGPRRSLCFPEEGA
jgi:hypothetical protein